MTLILIRRDFMYLLSILLLMLLCIGYSIVISNGNIFYYLDPASLLLVLLFVLPILLSAGLLKDFNNAFRLSVSLKKACARVDLLRAVESVNLAIKALWASGIFHSTFGIIHTLANTEGELLARTASVALITLLYAAFFVIMLLPLRSRLLVRLHELPEHPEKSDTEEP